MPNLYLYRLQVLDRLIYTKATGTPQQLARRLQISERSVYRYIDAMRTIGAPIAYCKIRGTYYYEQMGKFRICFTDE